MAKDDSLLPSPGSFLTDTLKGLYATSIQKLISDMGRVVTLTLPPSTSGCPNCKYLSIAGQSLNQYNSSNPFGGPPYNIPFTDGSRCPVCLSSHTINIPQSAEWHATIFKTPKDYDVSVYGTSPENILMTKMIIDAWEDVNRAIRATIDGKDYERLGEPTKIGLGNEDSDLKFVTTMWKRAS